MHNTVAIKKLILVMLLSITVILVKAQTPGTNYVRVRVPQEAISDTSLMDTIPVARQAVSIQYSDALGRSLQTIQVKGSPSQNDIVIPYVYDNMGRESTSYLPYADQGTNGTTAGTLRANAVNSVLQFYNPGHPGAPNIPTDASPYEKTVFEVSPLGRVMEQGAPGTVYQPGTGHTVTAGYHINSTADGINYYYGIPGSSTIPFTPFLPGTLSKTIVTDENGHSTEVWKDLQGRVVTKTRLGTTSSSGSGGSGGGSDTVAVYTPPPKPDAVRGGGRSPALGGVGPVIPPATQSAILSTDYIYNDLDQLSNIVTAVTKNQIANYGGVSTQNFIQQSYDFNYDSLGRLVEKKVPDKGWVYVVYNHSDRPVLSQDSNMRAKHQWMYMKYDAEGRLIQTGIYTNTGVSSRVAMQQLCDSYTALWETWQAGIGYTDNAFPQQSYISGNTPLAVYTLYYYDDYSFSEAASKPFQTNIYNTVPTKRTMGLVTGMSVYVLGTSNQRLVTVNYYDNQDRLIQELNDNHLGQVDVVNNQYNFVGQLTNSQRTTTAIAGQPITVQDRFVYDQLDRLLNTYESFLGNSELDVSHNQYNETGQLMAQGLHGTGSNFAQTQQFRYNIRGWLTNINNGTLTYDGGVTQSDSTALFGETITYDQPNLSGTTPQYNGNISSISWRNRTENLLLPRESTGEQAYAFTYDDYDRLTAGNYYMLDTVTAFGPSLNGAYNENVTGYDVMGNIDSLNRSDGSGNPVNDLVYIYKSNSNLLDSVYDAGSQNRSGSFTYDGNGNMVTDSWKGITIKYNYLNLPDTVIQGNNKLVFIYDATGDKLYKQLIINGTIVSQRHYVEGEEVTASTSVAYDGKVESVGMPEGRILVNGSNYQYEYELTDHLGNNRVTFRPNADGTLTVSNIQNYYPFGANMGDNTMNYSASPQNNYLYNSQELQRELNLNTYDFGARHYDATLGRWMAIDPLAAKYHDFSPYNYVENNPMNFIDPDGMGVVDPTYGNKFNIGKGGAGTATLGTASLIGIGVSTAISFYNAFKGLGGGVQVIDKDLNGHIRQAQGNPSHVQTGGNPNNGNGANQGGYSPLTHAQELDKYGQITGAGNISISGSYGGGITYEYGIVETNKGWSQRYKTVYFNLGYGISAGGNADIIIGRGSYKPTFSDWRGLAMGASISYTFFSGSAGTSDTYRVIGVGFGLGYGVKGNWNVLAEPVSVTTLIGSPFRTPSADLSNDYIKTQTYLGGQ